MKLDEVLEHTTSPRVLAAVKVRVRDMGRSSNCCCAAQRARRRTSDRTVMVLSTIKEDTFISTATKERD